MKMGFGFFDREDGFNAGLLRLRKLLQNGDMKQEDDRQALEPLTVVTEREPGPQILVAHDDAGALKHFLNAERQGIEARRAGAFADRHARGFANHSGDVRQSRIGGDDLGIEIGQGF